MRKHRYIETVFELKGPKKDNEKAFKSQWSSDELCQKDKDELEDLSTAFPIPSNIISRGHLLPKIRGHWAAQLPPAAGFLASLAAIATEVHASIY